MHPRTFSPPSPAPCPAPPCGPAPRHYAAIDLGTNLCRLLIVRAATGEGEPAPVTVQRFSQPTFLGEGLGRSGRLAPDAMQRTVEAIRAYAARIAACCPTERMRCVATAACRRAHNGQDFADRVQAETGITVEIIPEHEESLLTALGCQELLAPDVSCGLVFDIGGGSTEMALFSAGEHAFPQILASHSWPHGVSTLAEQFTNLHTSDETRHEKIVGQVSAAFAPFVARVQQGWGTCPRRVALLGNSGTITTLTAWILGQKKYRRDRIDGRTLARADLMQALDRLAGNPHLLRSEILFRNRSPAMMEAGCAIVRAILRAWPAQHTLRVADRGLREGIIRALILRDAAAR